MQSFARALVLVPLLLAACGGGSGKSIDAPLCPASQSDCGGTCATLTSDVNNCGACGNACSPGNVCSNGSCALSCQASLTDCSGTCANLMSDNANCGACGTACDAGQVCTSGQCALSCQSGLTECSGTCSNLMSDDANCGACGTACAPGQVCSAGTCQVSCQAGLTDCSGTCSNTSNDPANCGACGTTCGASQACVQGVCEDLALYAPDGPQQNVPESDLTGWSVCYHDLYNVNMQAQVSNIQTMCSGNKLLLACRQGGTTTFTVHAWGNRSDVFFDTGAMENQGHSDGKVLWYFDPNWSWGFATPGDTLLLNECDENSGPDRLCWHTINSSGGYRCGTTDSLNDSTAWERYIYQAN